MHFLSSVEWNFCLKITRDGSCSCGIVQFSEWSSACMSFFFFLSVGVRSLWQAGLPDETPAGARLQGEGRGAAARHSPLVAWRAPRPARLTPPPAGQEVERGQGRGPEKGCMEVEVGIGDNQYPMHLSISYSRGERGEGREIRHSQWCDTVPIEVVSGDTDREREENKKCNRQQLLST